jgi:hypothetical protein
MADAFSYATLYDDESSITRLLRDRSASKNSNATSAGMIAWYCFIVSMVLPTFLGVLHCWLTRYRSHQRAQATLDRELQNENDLVFSRMEANIQAFSKVEKNRRTKSMRAAIRLHVIVSRYIHFSIVFRFQMSVVNNVLSLSLDSYSESQKRTSRPHKLEKREIT